MFLGVIFCLKTAIAYFFLTNFKSGKTSLFVAFFNEERRASKKYILYSWNWKKSMHAKWSQKSKSSLVTEHPLSLWVFVLRSSGVEMLQWPLIFTGYIITSSFSWSLYSALDRMNRLHCPAALENPERCETSFYRIVFFTNKVFHSRDLKTLLTQ